MKVVPAVPFGARGCSITARPADPQGFIQVNSPVSGDRLHISAEAVKIMGNEFGMIPREQAIDMRFRISELEKELRSARDTIARNEQLEEDLVEARETIRESDEILAVFRELAEAGYSTQKAKGLLKRIEGFKESLDEAVETIAELDDALARSAALAQRKVLA